MTALPAAAQDTPPWMFESDNVRQYKNFRSLQLEPNSQTQPQQYAYQATQTQPGSVLPAIPTAPIIQPPTSNSQTPSTIEAMYAARILSPLTQFGYDMFGVPTDATLAALSATQKTTPSGAVQDDFVLGAGDELEILFTGQRRDRLTATINTNGLLIIPDMPPIPAAGRTIGQVRISIQSAAQNLHNTEAFVSLTSVRQIGALVIGHVKRPGRKNLTVFHTVLDALMESGGIDKTGSLRQIKLVRDGRSTIIDLYALLMHGQSAVDLRLPTPATGENSILFPLQNGRMVSLLC